MAMHDGLTFGHQVVFTFGPLGFLGVNQLWFGDLAELSFVYLVLIRLALARPCSPALGERSVHPRLFSSPLWLRAWTRS
jgi:hypothetical protein